MWSCCCSQLSFLYTLLTQSVSFTAMSKLIVLEGEGMWPQELSYRLQPVLQLHLEAELVPHPGWERPVRGCM